MTLDFEKYPDGLVPAIVQDADTRAVLMLGYMDRDAVDATGRTGNVTFYSRSRKRPWVKGESSGNFLKLVRMSTDCDGDALLVAARPLGPVCHKGTTTCFGEPDPNVVAELERVIEERRRDPAEGSYVASLFEGGINRIAQKVGEEAVETVIAAMGTDGESFRAEAADLLFHYLVLLNAKGVSLSDVAEELGRRRR